MSNIAGNGRGRTGLTRYKNKIVAPIEVSDLEAILNACKSTEEKAIVVLLYYTGLRVSEIVGDTKRKWRILTKKGRQLSKSGTLPDNWLKDTANEGELWEWRYRDELQGIMQNDIKIRGKILYLKSDPLKHGIRETSLELDADLPYLNYVVEAWKATPKGGKVFNGFSQSKVWRLLSKITDGQLYSHAFRASRATTFSQDSRISLSDLMGWFGWASAETANKYLLRAKSTSISRRVLSKPQRNH